MYLSTLLFGLGLIYSLQKFVLSINIYIFKPIMARCKVTYRLDSYILKVNRFHLCTPIIRFDILARLQKEKELGNLELKRQYFLQIKFSRFSRSHTPIPFFSDRKIRWKNICNTICKSHLVRLQKYLALFFSFYYRINNMVQGTCQIWAKLSHE